MGRTRTVRLEILRHGPPHNQLLSPLTGYFALCGNQPGDTLRLPYEHRQFELLQRVLRYQDCVDADVRRAHLDAIGAQQATLFGAVPGFTSDFDGETADLVDLHVVTSASEIALLPIEALWVPPGLPGQGQPLVLQAVRPASITRSVRRVSTVAFSWPERPRILFASACPPGVGTIPEERHLVALRLAARWWEQRASIVDTLPFATIEAIKEACRRTRYTHVHILAHGLAERADHTRFGLALHDSRNIDALDVVSGARLASALRTTRADGTLSRPSVVTVASCDSGGVGSVIPPGASLAHALHEADIPLVVASQFPLSKDGSTIFTRDFYEGILDGRDPRYVLRDVRCRLQAMGDHFHDWASLVCYASLPADADLHFARARFGSAVQTAAGILGRLDGAQGWDPPSETARPTASAGPQAGPGSGGAASVDAIMKLLEERLEATRVLVEGAADDPRLDGARRGALGLLASLEKRSAAQRWLRGEPSKRDEALRKELGAAKQHYITGAGLAIRGGWVGPHSLGWLATQVASLSAVLGFDGEARHWIAIADVASREDLRSSDPEMVAWAHGSLAETAMLRAAMADANRAARWAKRAEGHALAIRGAAGIDPFVAFSTARQFKRYIHEWGAIAPRLVPVARSLVEVLAEADV